MNRATKYQKTVPASTEYLIEVREFVSKHARSHGFSEKQINDIRLAVDEACTNIIKHAYQFDDSKHFAIEMNFQDQNVTVLIIDQGAGFDPTRYHKPELKDQIKKKKRGGMGIYLIKSLMDEVTYSKVNDENVLRMKKIRKQSA